MLDTHPGHRRPQHRRLRAARCEGGMTMQKPFAITLDLGSSLANKTGSWRTERPVYVDRLPPCNTRARRAKTSRAGSIHAEERRLRSRVARARRGQPVARHHGAGLLSPVRERVQPRHARQAVGINSVERFLGDEALKQRLALRAARRPRRASTCWSSAPGPRACRPPTICARLGHDVTIIEAGPLRAA